MEASEQQQSIIDYEGNVVIIASPGSGKTFVLSQKIKKCLSKIQNYQGVIAISYTNKASNELKKRSLSDNEDPKSSFFGTIDSFYLSDIIYPFGKHFLGNPKHKFEVKSFNTLKREYKEMCKWYKNYEDRKTIDIEKILNLKILYLEGIIVLETIGILARVIFENSQACQKYIRAKYKYLFIDEYQDSGLEQHYLFLKIMNLGIIATAVGDLNQSIFGYDGRNAEYLREVKDNEKFKYFILNVNHRCHSSIINYSNFLLNQTKGILDVDDKRIFYIKVKGDESAIAKWIDNKITSLQKKYEISSKSQIAILTKSNKKAEIISQLLQTPNRVLQSNEIDIDINPWSIIFSNLLLFLYNKKNKFIDIVELFKPYDNFKNYELKKLISSKKNIELIFSKTPVNFDLLLIEFVKIAGIISPDSYSNKSIELLSKVFQNQNFLRNYLPINENEVNILTLHKSKGLEYEAIIHLDLYKFILPKKEYTAFDSFEYIQDLNLHYVGITRAKKICILLGSTQRTYYNGQISDCLESEFITKFAISELRFDPNDYKKIFNV